MKHIISTLLENPALFYRKALRRITQMCTRRLHHLRFLFSAPQMYDFCSKQQPETVLFDLADAWASERLPTPKEIQRILKGELTIFGHTTTVSSDDKRWHDDLRLAKSENPDYSSTFSLNICITQSAHPTLNVFGYDVKYPWERSRLQYLIPLGRVYAQNPESHEHIFTFFKEEITSWIQHNPFMQGVNWMNAMEIGIRASSLIWLFKFFYAEKTSDDNRAFWNTYLNTLLRHAEFIEAHWEQFDKPNNHYLLDLTGAWYLATFFARYNLFPLGNLTTLWQKVCTGFREQLNNDGTSYEGSTAYHRLVLQALRDCELLGKNTGYALPPELTEKLAKGIQFLADATVNNETLIQIGDNDSGFLIAPLSLTDLPDALSKQKQESTPCVRNYPDFGCIFIINKEWHISLRTKSFDDHSPRGHFHEDLLGITVAYQGKPYIVDSGTGCYTSNATLRNTLRSRDAHSTIAVETQPEAFASLFNITGPSIPTEKPLIAGSGIAPTITAQYTTAGIRLTRSIKLSTEQNSVFITDVAESLEKHKASVTTNILLAHNIIPEQVDPGIFALLCEGTELTMEWEEANTAYRVAPTYISEEYGSVTRSLKITFATTTPHHATVKISPKI